MGWVGQPRKDPVTLVRYSLKKLTPVSVVRKPLRNPAPDRGTFRPCLEFHEPRRGRIHANAFGEKNGRGGERKRSSESGTKKKRHARDNQTTGSTIPRARRRQKRVETLETRKLRAGDTGVHTYEREHACPGSRTAEAAGTRAYKFTRQNRPRELSRDCPLSHLYIHTRTRI